LAASILNVRVAGVPMDGATMAIGGRDVVYICQLCLNMVRGRMSMKSSKRKPGMQLQSSRWPALMVLLVSPLSLWAQPDGVPDPQWRVARAQFTTGIVDREPVDRIVVATPLIREVYFFTDLRHLEGRTVTHRWSYDGRVVMQTSFEVRGPRWRVNSMKEIEPDQVGEWSVTVSDESGWPLYTELFRYENGAPLLQDSDGSGADSSQ
jgi:hypothetical protein